MSRLVIAAGPADRRRWLTDVLTQGNEEIEVVAEAADVPSVLAAVKRTRPDLLVLDAAIPPADADTAVRRVMAEQPCPMVIAALEPRHAIPASQDQLRQAGALSIVDLSAPRDTEASSEQQHALLDAVRVLAGIAVVGRRRHSVPDHPEIPRPTLPSAPGVVAISASTGGPEALATVLSALPADFPLPLLIVQHISTGFHETLARWLDEQSPLTVRVATKGDVAMPGLALVAPNDCHLLLSHGGRIELDDQTPPVGGHRPSATRLFRSIARVAGRNSIGVVLTGMGLDGRQGLLDLNAAGGYVIAQDEATSTVFGMAKEAIDAGAIHAVLPLPEISRALEVRTHRPTRASAMLAEQ